MSEDDRIAALEKRIAELEARGAPEMSWVRERLRRVVDEPLYPIFSLDDESYKNVTIRRVASIDEPWADVDRPGT